MTKEGANHDDIQGHVSKITLSIDAILSTSNPGAAGNFYTDDCVLVPADLLLLRANITKLSEFATEHIRYGYRSIKAKLNTLFHSKTGKLMRGEGCSKSFDEEGLMNLKRVNSQFKHGQCKDMFLGVLLLKNKSRKRSQKQNKSRSN